MTFFKMRKLIARLKTESELTGSEREALRARLLAQTGLTETAPHYLVSMFPHYAKVAALSLALIAIGVTPLAIAAEQSEPGDILYPVKTKVTEPIKKAAKSIFLESGNVPVENPPQTEAAVSKSEDEKPQKQKRTDTEAVLPHVKTQSDIPIIPGAVEETTPSIQKTVDKIKEQLPLLKGNERKYDKNENQEEKKKKDDDDESGVDDVVDTVRNTAEDAKEAADDVKDSIKETVNDVTDLGL